MSPVAPGHYSQKQLGSQCGIVRWTHAEEHSGLRRENSELLAEIAKLG